ncbi:MAG: hypothetical protein VYC27_04925 [Candidatus Thermoplasmatota archaeon]|nr:hypothetical protein [Candidatus Thermoplasmatota archaeon]MEE2666968.1 hypothetical protein [Candidatus Thermoplasmatota archaeon]
MGEIVPASAGPMQLDREVLDGLHLAGMRGRVAVEVDPSALLIRAKEGKTTTLPLSSISSFNHHQTHLMPPYSHLFGFILIGMAGWTIEMVAVRNVVMTVGCILVGAWALTRRPTLTVDLHNGECHVITGADGKLMMLAYLMGRLMAGQPLAEAREGLSDLMQPRSTPEALVVPTPITGLLEGEIVPRAAPDEAIMADFFDEASTLAPSIASPAPAVNITIEDRRAPMQSDAYLAPVHVPVPVTPPRDGLHARAQQMMIEQRETLPSPSYDALNPRTPVDREEAQQAREEASSPFAVSGTGWQAVHQEQRALPAPRVEAPLPAFDPGTEPYLPSFVGPTGDSRPAPAPEPEPMFPVMGLQEPMPPAAPVETAPEPPAAPVRGIVGTSRRSEDERTVAPAGQPVNLQPKTGTVAPRHLIPRPASGVRPRRRALGGLFDAALRPAAPSPQEQDYAAMYGDEDGVAVAAEDVAPMSTWQHTRLRTDASSQAIVDEHTRIHAGSSGGERADDRLRDLLDDISVAPLPASEETLTGERQGQIASSFSDMIEVHTEPAAGRPFMDLDRLDG